MTWIPESGCQPHLGLDWSLANWWIFRWLATSKWLLPLILAAVFAVLLLRHLPYRNLVGAGAAGLLLLYGLSVTPEVTALGHRLLMRGVLPAVPPGSADAIVVLGRGPRLRTQRVEATVQLWQAQRAPLIWISGRIDAAPLARQLEQRGIPASAIVGETCSRTTEENAQFTAQQLLPQARRIVLVTDQPHQLRSHLTFASLGFQVASHPTSLPITLSRRERGTLQLREYLGLISYGLLGRYSPRSPVTPNRYD